MTRQHWSFVVHASVGIRQHVPFSQPRGAQQPLEPAHVAPAVPHAPQWFVGSHARPVQHSKSYMHVSPVIAHEPLRQVPF
jgi:hypothetical protein